MSGLSLALAVPAVCAALLWWTRTRAIALACAPWTAAPAFLLAIAGAPEVVSWPSVLFGLDLGVDPVDRGFLLLTSAVWLAAGVFGGTYMAAAPRRARFWTSFLVTQAANLGVVLAFDVASFYCFYSVMTIAAFGLVVHEETPLARRAARIYLVLALLGELAVLAAMFLIVGPRIDLPLSAVPEAIASSPSRDAIVVLVLLGFGVKTGALGLHVWLPLAHPAAPTPASAVLSGALVKAGLLGWLRFLPLGAAALPATGLVCVAAGLLAAFYAIAVGLAQRDGKTVLAYSSVSQMGFIGTTVGIALAVPEAADTAKVAVMFYAIHHAIAKATLFLGYGLATQTTGRWPRRLVLGGLVLAALDLAGAPLSSGALAKLTIKDVVASGPWEAPSLTVLLSIGAIGSMLLMLHFLRIVAAQRPAHDAPVRIGMWLPWCALLAASVALLAAAPLDSVTARAVVDPGHAWSAIWPVATGLALFVVIRRLRVSREIVPAIPPGDVVVLYERAARALTRVAHVVADRATNMQHAFERARASPIERLRRTAARILELEPRLATLPAIGVLFAGLIAIGLVRAWMS